MDKKNVIIYSPIRGNGGPTGGLSDRLKGIVFAYSLALIGGKDFRIYWPSWQTQMPLDPKMPGLILEESECVNGLSRIDLIDWVLRDHSGDVESIISHAESLPTSVVNANILSFEELSARKEILKRRLKIKEWDEPSLFSAVFCTLFSVSEKVTVSELARSFEEEKKRGATSIGIQLRCGGWQNWRDPIMDHPRIAKHLYRAVCQIKKENVLNNVFIYFSSDNERAKRYAEKSLAINHKLLMSRTQESHFERSDRKSSGAFLDIHVDQYCLSRCDYIITGRGGFGLVAAYRKGVCPYRYWDFFKKPFYIDILERLKRAHEKLKKIFSRLLQFILKASNGQR